MGMMERRRVIMASRFWKPMSANNMSQWSYNYYVTLSNGVLTFKPRSLDWGCNLTPNNLNFKYGNVKNGKVHIKYDYSISKAVKVNSTTRGYLTIASATWNTKNPNKDSTRDSWGTLSRIDTDSSGNASGSVDNILNVPDTIASGTLPPNDNYYYGVRFYAYTGNGSTVVVSNLIIELIS